MINVSESGDKEHRWLDENYGSRRGFIRTYWHRLLYYLGRYNQYHHIDWSSVDRLVFVCKGNICRSVYAEAVARSLGVDAVSCGLDTIENAPANKEAMLSAKALGYDLEGHNTKPVMYLVLKKSDLLVTMEPWQCKYLAQHLFRAHHCTLLGLWTRPVSPHIQDPYGSTTYYFDRCFKDIQHAVKVLAGKINQ